MADTPESSKGLLQKLRNIIDTAFANVLSMFVAFLILGGLVTGIRGTAEWLGANASPGLAFGFVVLCGVAWLLILLLVKPDMLRNVNGRILPGVVVGFVAASAFVWIYIFGLFSSLLMKLGLVQYTFKGGPGTELSDLCDSYLWHLLDLIPALDINKALGWDADVDLQGGARGFVLISFRILIVYQLFGFGRRLLEARKARRAEAATSEPGAHAREPDEFAL